MPVRTCVHVYMRTCIYVNVLELHHPNRSYFIFPFPIAGHWDFAQNLLIFVDFIKFCLELRSYFDYFVWVDFLLLVGLSQKF